MAVKVWATKERSFEHRQNPEDQRMIDVYESLLAGELTPEAAARSLAAICEPLIKQNPNDLRIGGIWLILCDAVRALGNSIEANERLVDLLSSIKELPEVVDEHGNALKHEWGGRYWTDLPMWALSFREYGIAIETDEDMEQSEWLAQVAPFLNASSFSATNLHRVPSMVDLTFYAELCLNEALEYSYDTPEPLDRAAMYVPPAATWILLAGERIHQLCKENYKRSDSESSVEGLLWNGRGFSLERWAFWKQRFSDIMESDGFDDNARNHVRRAVEEIRRIENRYD